METRTLRQVLVDEFNRAIEAEDQVSLPELAKSVIDGHRDEIQDEIDALTFRAVLAQLKQIANSAADETGQLEFFGFPRVIAIPNGGSSYVYMEAEKCTFAQLEAGLEIRDNNVVKAQAKRDAYMSALNAVRSIMQGTDLPLCEAVKTTSALTA